mmetsp:Transcript_1452/g.2221  ORF Transcript_1452/g.2221 Transcript_1452/m.2221 type:complete len:128 (+) Transcript_1452:284-667(+)
MTILGCVLLEVFLMPLDSNAVHQLVGCAGELGATLDQGEILNVALVQWHAHVQITVLLVLLTAKAMMHLMTFVLQEASLILQKQFVVQHPVVRAGVTAATNVQEEIPIVALVVPPSHAKITTTISLV